MSDNTLLVVDVGSSALKAVLFGARGEPIAAVSHPVTTHHRSDRSHEQDPDDWWSALRAAVSKLPENRSISAIAFSGSMQNLIALQADGSPVAPAILYSDRRLEQSEVEHLGARLPSDYAHKVGNHLDPAHTILKLMSRGRFMPEVASKPVLWTFGAKDALTFRLTGERVIDPTTASTTGLMNIAQRAWVGELLGVAGVDEHMLPRIEPADAIVGHVNRQAAQQLGLPEGIPVFNGSGDAGAATWGASADKPGTAYCYLGTTGWVAATLDHLDAAPPRDVYTLADPVRPGRAIVISPFLTAGSALDWLSQTTNRPIEQLLEAMTPASTEAALFLPYLGGERGPFEDSKVRGAFLGLSHTSDPGELAFATMEGIAFAVRHNLEAAGLPRSNLPIIGGAVRHARQRQVLADALGRSITIPGDSEMMTAMGVLKMVSAAAGIAVDTDIQTTFIEPRRECTHIHDRRYAAYLSASSFARDLSQYLG